MFVIKTLSMEDQEKLTESVSCRITPTAKARIMKAAQKYNLADPSPLIRSFIESGLDVIEEHDYQVSFAAKLKLSKEE